MEEEKKPVEETPVVNEPVASEPTVNEPVVNEPEVKKEKDKSKGLFIILIIGVVLIAAALVASIIINNASQPKKKEEKSQKEELGYEVLDNEKVRKIIANFILVADKDCNGELYPIFINDEIEAKDLDKTFVADVIASYAYEHGEVTKDSKVVIDEEKYKAIGTRLFGSAYNGEVPQELDSNMIFKRTDSGQLEITKAEPAKKCAVTTSHFKVSTNKLKDDVLTVNVRTAFSKQMDYDTSLQYRDAKLKNVIGVADIGNINYENYYPRGDLYRLTFQKFADSYMFVKSELLSK